ncbi:hypothetical protein J2W17_002855 [Pseudomonas lini]|uniref:sn-glycerol-3-phosphate transporter n=1 Tax=Pseudomonas lini TaxID=163011 RepID=UPI00278755CC|nr:sn-glycerol-3-phosphate transporter [Pseudomonas lini]MDQ0123908.1 hypothetical protein [Pseudomonas lini]
MKYSWIYSLFVLIQASHALALDIATHTADKGFWYAQTSVYTRHYSPTPEHNNRQRLLGLERNLASGTIFGATTFRNSYRQRSYYAYAGKRYQGSDYPVYLKLSGGLLQGYKGEYRKKVPLNRLGAAPVIIPSVGVHFGAIGAEVVLLGTNAAMITTGLRF